MSLKHHVTVRLATPDSVPTTTITAAIALALEGEAIKEVGSIEVEAIEVWTEEAEE